MLKLSKEKWDEARDHALAAVVPDNAMRAWWRPAAATAGAATAGGAFGGASGGGAGAGGGAGGGGEAAGLLFACHMAKVDLERPAGGLSLAPPPAEGPGGACMKGWLGMMARGGLLCASSTAGRCSP